MRIDTAAIFICKDFSFLINFVNKYCLFSSLQNVFQVFKYLTGFMSNTLERNPVRTHLYTITKVGPTWSPGNAHLVPTWASPTGTCFEPVDIPTWGPHSLYGLAEVVPNWIPYEFA